jgi:hypothetical protein
LFDSPPIVVSDVVRFLAGEVGVIFELSDQKAQCFLVLIVFKWLLSEHARMLLGEMSVRT